LENFAIRVNNITKTFKLPKPQGVTNIFKGKLNSSGSEVFTALNEISFTVKKGEILGIIGFNGSGKTTLLRVISGVYKPDSGSVKINGQISPLLQLGAGFQGDLAAEENIIMNGMLFGLPKSSIKEKVKDIIEFAELEKFSQMKLKHYSTGMKARLTFATAMQINPDILLVDEIQAVGDKNFKEKSYQTFLSFKKNNKTIIHTTHNLSKLSEYSDRVLLLHQGKNVMIGNPEEVIKKYMDLKTN